jgi:subtilisin-like proprotein convertase family protein
VLSHGPQFGITAVNMSLGSLIGSSDGTTPAPGPFGYCDALSDGIAYVQPIERLKAAGILSFASAGNSGVTNQIDSPACVSSVASVGAVYADNYGSVAYLPPAPCTDDNTAPDHVTCYSQSSSALALLAPGSFWSVTRMDGNRNQRFAGTSASSPAAAGVALLVHQAKPDISPDELLALLRLTGRPVLDPRNSVTTPRVDAGAAVVSPPSTPVVSPTTPVSLPPGGSARAFVTVSDSGFVESLAVAFSVDHPDPTRLKATLAAPDGTSAILWDHQGSAGQPLNALFGGEAGGPLSVFPGHGAPGTWALTVTGDPGSAAGTIRSFWVAATTSPLPIPSAVPADAHFRVFPLIGRTQGTHLFESDARLFNPGPSPRRIDLYFVPVGGNGQTGARRVSYTLSPLQVLALDDMLQSSFGLADALGEISLVSSDVEFLGTARAYSVTPVGTFGTFVPARHTSEAVGPGEKAYANGLRSDASFHTNIGFTEVSGHEATVRIDLRDSSGNLLTTATRSAAPNAAVFDVDALHVYGLAGEPENVRADFTVTSTAGRILPFAVVVDAATGDGVNQPAVKAEPDGDDTILAQVSHATGDGNFYTTDVHVTNLSSNPTQVTVSLLPRFTTGEPAGTQQISLAPGETREVPDVLSTLFGLQDPSAAGLRFHPSAPAPLLITARTATREFGGTSGFFTPGEKAQSSLVGGGGRHLAVQLDQNESFRTNFAITEVLGGSATVRVRARDGQGNVLSARDYTLSPNTSVGDTLDSLLNHGSASNVSLEFEVVSGTGGVLAAATAIDNRTQDAIYSPAVPEP